MYINIEQTEQYINAILKNARDWANGTGMPLYPEDVAVLGEYLNMRIPVAFYKFEESERPDVFSASGGYITISKTLERLQKKILNGALNQFTDAGEKDSVIKTIREYKKSAAPLKHASGRTESAPDL